MRAVYIVLTKPFFTSAQTWNSTEANKSGGLFEQPRSGVFIKMINFLLPRILTGCCARTHAHVLDQRQSF